MQQSFHAKQILCTRPAVHRLTGEPFAFHLERAAFRKLDAQATALQGSPCCKESIWLSWHLSWHFQFPPPPRLGWTTPAPTIRTKSRHLLSQPQLSPASSARFEAANVCGSPRPTSSAPPQTCHVFGPGAAATDAKSLGDVDSCTCAREASTQKTTRWNMTLSVIYT